MKRHNLLLVDDEKDILRTLGLTFEEDYEVFTARSGMEALGVLERHDIALIIADQRMPEMTGVELLQRSITLNPHIIRIILTGYNPHYSDRLYRYGRSHPGDQQRAYLSIYHQTVGSAGTAGRR